MDRILWKKCLKQIPVKMTELPILQQRRIMKRELLMKTDCSIQTEFMSAIIRLQDVNLSFVWNIPFSSTVPSS